MLPSRPVVALVFGLVIIAMIYATGHLSGAHLNPAVTLAFVVTRHFPAPRPWPTSPRSAHRCADRCRLPGGTTPGERVHPEVIEVMAELGIDLTDRKPRELTREDAEWADVVVTMGCGDECPYVPGARYVDWDLPDPKGRPVEEVRATREEIARRVEALAVEL